MEEKVSEYARPLSEIGYYHLILRGNGKQIIFEERSDYVHFLQNLKQYSTENEIKINAFCLMENHVHLLVFDKKRNLPVFMKRLAGNYSIWFNKNIRGQDIYLKEDTPVFLLRVKTDYAPF